MAEAVLAVQKGYQPERLSTLLRRLFTRSRLDWKYSLLWSSPSPDAVPEEIAAVICKRATLQMTVLCIAHVCQVFLHSDSITPQALDLALICEVEYIL